MADRGSFGAETTVDEVLEGIDLSGRVAIVTGASGGLGAEAARGLAQAGAAVTLTARDLAKGAAVAESIRQSTGNAAVDVMELELSQPASVRAFAKGWLAEHGALNLLLNNAGVMASPLARTDAGWEMQFATCHLGHFLLTALLAPALEAGAPARVVNVSSGGHRFSPVRFDDPNFESSEYDKWIAYGQAKTANVLHAVELDRRLRGRGVRAFAIHPGAIATDLGRHLTRDDMVTLQARAPGGKGLQLKPVEAGAATEVYAATAPELEGQGGCYLEDCHVAGSCEELGATDGVAPHALDPVAAARLWTLSEQMLGEAFAL
ncbi:MAG: SDR family NAD(P)-dependent oxidoreductase [Deltaproteobacteria bacterium]|nr:SDR family NAD(P)-dependent oxidoreductase [Deltaproteobacteria bacterium]MBW2359380.1 SDR family NAD(P)-dependent oxidoreductase [Deltaproteobacteria bacterium]